MKNKMKNKIPSDKAFETFERMFQTRIDVAKQLIKLMVGNSELAALEANYKTLVKNVPVVKTDEYSPRMRKLIEAFNDSINVEWFLLSRLNYILWLADRKKDVRSEETTKDGC